MDSLFSFQHLHTFKLAAIISIKMGGQVSYLNQRPVEISASSICKPQAQCVLELAVFDEGNMKVGHVTHKNAVYDDCLELFKNEEIFNVGTVGPHQQNVVFQDSVHDCAIHVDTPDGSFNSAAVRDAAKLIVDACLKTRVVDENLSRCQGASWNIQVSGRGAFSDVANTQAHKQLYIGTPRIAPYELD